MSRLMPDADAFLATFGEPVVAIVGGVSRSITAVVTREPPQQVPEMTGVLHPLCKIEVANAATGNADSAPFRGVSSAEVDTSSTKFQFALRIGGATQTLSVHSIASQDDKMISLELR